MMLTRKEIRAFQLDHREYQLVPDGILGAQTVNAIRRAWHLSPAMPVMTVPPIVEDGAPIFQITPEIAFNAILLDVKGAPDPLAKAGEWITRVTNGITEIIRDTDA